MDLPTFRQLLTPAGQAALAEAADRAESAELLAVQQALRKRHPPALARAAVETVDLRTRARAKFAAADRMYFTREAFEQASGGAVAAHRAGRLAAHPVVLDLCCGVGADTLALAAGCRVEAVDADELRLAMAGANAEAVGVADRVRFHLGDILTMPLPPADAAFVDPSRRAGDRRLLAPERYDPPLGAVVGRLPPGFPLAAKIAPGVARADLARYDAEAEFVSVDGELKECVLWFGPLRAGGLRATVLVTPPPRGEGSHVHTLAADRPPPVPPPAEVGAYLFDPDPAVVRADLVGLLAGQLGAAPTESGVAVLTGPTDVRSPFADGYRVEHAAPYHPGRLRDYLRSQGVGRLTVLKRAVELDANEVLRALKLGGPNHRHLILTRSGGKTVAVVAEEVL